MPRRNPGFSVVSVILLCACTVRAGHDEQKASSEQVKILFTGQLMGYFRIPDKQPGVDAEGCSAAGDVKQWSLAAKEFSELKKSVPGAILLGTGDNFAPRYEARVFDSKPKPLKPLKRGEYRSAGKDQYVYVWYPEDAKRDKFDGKDGKEVPNGWVYFEEAAKLENFQTLLEQGNGRVPTDNVGCFLKHEGYTAVVPGRHDFYFGIERLRELARFLSANDGSHPVAMLGANLVIETAWRSDHKPPPDTERRWSYAPHWPPDAPQLVIPGDKGKVYPWLPGAILKLADLPSTSCLYQLIWKDAYSKEASGRCESTSRARACCRWIMPA